MYIGHVGIALGLRRARSAPALWLLVVAAQLPDWGDALLELSGGRPPDPGWSPHGWPLVGLGSLGAALVGARIARTWRGGALAAFACVSHWAADYVTGQKPTWPGGPASVGLGWYGRPWRDLLVECVVTLAGWVLWRGSLPRESLPRESLPRESLPRTAGAAVGGSPRDARLAWALLGLLFGLQVWADVVMARHNGGWGVR